MIPVLVLVVWSDPPGLCAYRFDMIPVLVLVVWSDPPGLWLCGVIWFGGKGLIDDKGLICMYIFDD